jgi:hypothetical protein
VIQLVAQRREPLDLGGLAPDAKEERESEQAGHEPIFTRRKPLRKPRAKRAI